jgi:hypothetical protein
MRVIVFTSPRYAHLLRPFAHLFNTFWSSLQEVVIAGVPALPFTLPDNYTVSAIGSNRPSSEWQEGARDFLESIPDEWFVLMLEDYWLCRTVDLGGIGTLAEYARGAGNVTRIDLTTDVLHGYGDGRNAREICHYGHYDIIEKGTDVQYRMSLQAGIFHRERLIKLLTGGSPWELELHNHLQGDNTQRVIGCRQWPVRYVNAVDKGRLNWDQINRLPKKELEEIKPWIYDV